MSRLKTIGKMLALWGLSPWPPTPTTWKALASTLKHCGYSSAHVYLSTYRSECERRGFSLNATLLRSVADYNRSCLRGLGAPARPSALPLLRLCELPLQLEPLVQDGPMNTRAAMMVGAWWLCREVELSTARARLVVFERLGSGKLKATLHLPASKTDLRAEGVSRSLLCSCSPSSSPSSCVVHVLLQHVGVLRREFLDRWTAEGPEFDLPLFPTMEGEVVTKHAMAECVREAGRQLGVPVASPDGSERITGHSLRVTGAQGLTLLGWHLWTVQLHGRWGSDVVKRYIRDAPLAAAATTSSPSPARELDVEAPVAVIVS